jgi:hypothetical protein
MCWHLVSLKGRKEQDPDPLVKGTDPEPLFNVTGPEHSLKSRIRLSPPACTAEGRTEGVADSCRGRSHCGSTGNPPYKQE